GCSASQWCLWLVEMQMNTFEFFDFSTNMLKKEFINCESEAALLELLFHYLKWYNHSKSKPGVSYQENFPEIKFQMYNWLEEEIEFLSRKKELATKIEVRNENTANQEKILVDLSVAQLAYGIKILIEGGFIKTNNVKHVLRVAARVLKTKITESISEDSLRSKFYEIETSTYLEVHEKIKKILNFTKL
ncbi:MAG: hypothetical protein ACRC6O_03835, partial [Flavobacterium sp.]